MPESTVSNMSLLGDTSTLSTLSSSVVSLLEIECVTGISREAVLRALFSFSACSTFDGVSVFSRSLNLSCSCCSVVIVPCRDLGCSLTPAVVLLHTCHAVTVNAHTHRHVTQSSPISPTSPEPPVSPEHSGITLTKHNTPRRTILYCTSSGSWCCAVAFSEELSCSIDVLSKALLRFHTLILGLSVVLFGEILVNRVCVDTKEYDRNACSALEFVSRDRVVGRDRYPRGAVFVPGERVHGHANVPVDYRATRCWIEYDVIVDDDFAVNSVPVVRVFVHVFKRFHSARLVCVTYVVSARRRRLDTGCCDVNSVAVEGLSSYTCMLLVVGIRVS